MHRAWLCAVAGLFLGSWTTFALGQEPSQPQLSSPPLEVGAAAPDFALPGATRYGVLKDPIRLSHFKGKTVVLAFFFRARTRG
jgi:hypothetical protein